MPFQLIADNATLLRHTIFDLHAPTISVLVGSVDWAKTNGEPFLALYNTRDGGYSGYCFIGDPSLVGAEGQKTYDWLPEEASGQDLTLFLERRMQMTYDRVDPCRTKRVDKKTVAALAIKLQQERQLYQQKQERWELVESLATQDDVQADEETAHGFEYQISFVN
ncbi:hypothetical protein NliqN6_1695 [Naganishia liquefaciens]|uniref:Uncharacterized protein n=1 Tax=Naganishia liquefaciens TaxID=104408 RepID=A0A8H3TR03_9TREE|nr:hypothetical protein NliqN6_1695 [Naganishia liquefaciens]